MPDSDTTLDTDLEPAELVDEAPVEVTAQVVPAEQVVETTPDEPQEPSGTRALAIRHVLERQLAVSQGLSTELVCAATDATVAVVHAPAIVVNEIRGGAALPTAIARASETTRAAVTEAGGRVRSAVGGYANSQATLPNAIVTGMSDIAGSLARAQGEVALSALNSAFAVAVAGTRGDDVRAEFTQEREELGESAAEAREQIGQAVARARTELRAATPELRSR